jgi:hypothetical protein
MDNDVFLSDQYSQRDADLLHSGRRRSVALLQSAPPGNGIDYRTVEPR